MQEKGENLIGLVRKPYYHILGEEKKEAIINYKSYVEKIIWKQLKIQTKTCLEDLFWVELDFVNWVKDKFLSARDDEKEIPQLKKLKPKVSIKTILQRVCDEFGCSEEQIQRKGRKGNTVRTIAIYLARDLSGMSCKNLGVFFGGITGAAITMKYNQMNAELVQHKKLSNKIMQIKKHLLFKM